MIGQRIKEIRHNSNLTQQELADGIISRTYLSLIEKGSVQPSTNVLIKLSERLKCSVDDFLNEVASYEYNDVEILKEISHYEYQLNNGHFDHLKTFIDKDLIRVKNLPTEYAGRIHALYGKYYINQGNTKDAEKHLTNAIQQLSQVPFHQNYIDCCLLKVHLLINEKSYEAPLEILDDLFFKLLKFEYQEVELIRVYFYYARCLYELSQYVVAKRMIDKLEILKARLLFQYQETYLSTLKMRLLYRLNHFKALEHLVQSDNSEIGQLFSTYCIYQNGNIMTAKSMFESLNLSPEMLRSDDVYSEIHALLDERLQMI